MPDHSNLAPGVAMPGAEQGPIPERPALLLHAVYGLREKWVVKVGEEDADRVRPSPDQTPGELVGPVPELRRRPQYGGSTLLAHVGSVAHHQRDQGLGDLRALRHVQYRDPRRSASSTLAHPHSSRDGHRRSSCLCLFGPEVTAYPVAPCTPGGNSWRSPGSPAIPRC